MLKTCSAYTCIERTTNSRGIAGGAWIASTVKGVHVTPVQTRSADSTKDKSFLVDMLQLCMCCI